jgi:NTP pyrophosphatase (non-canonical NTP hydrolase)
VEGELMNKELRNELRRIARDKDRKTATELVNKLFEEGGELSRAAAIHARVDGTAYRSNKDSLEDVKEEAADCYIVLMAILERHGITDDELEEWILRKKDKWERVVNDAETRAVKLTEVVVAGEAHSIVDGFTTIEDQSKLTKIERLKKEVRRVRQDIREMDEGDLSCCDLAVANEVHDVIEGVAAILESD